MVRAVDVKTEGLGGDSEIRVGLNGELIVGPERAVALSLLAARYPDAQFYLDLRGVSPKPVSTAEAMAHVIRAYHPTSKLPESEQDLSAIYISLLYGKRALLVMDNAKDRRQVEPLIPPAGCVLIVTSRQHFTLPGIYDRDLDALPNRNHLRVAPRARVAADQHAPVRTDSFKCLCTACRVTWRLTHDVRAAERLARLDESLDH
ncbi:MAG: hypothetical protein HC855_03495, partial [Rhizobiales bacterium]|nr:hypothetical protein [Hyphomicrobiales bacterium]